MKVTALHSFRTSPRKCRKLRRRRKKKSSEDGRDGSDPDAKESTGEVEEAVTKTRDARIESSSGGSERNSSHRRQALQATKEESTDSVSKTRSRRRRGNFLPSVGGVSSALRNIYVAVAWEVHPAAGHVSQVVFVNWACEVVLRLQVNQNFSMMSNSPLLPEQTSESGVTKKVRTKRKKSLSTKGPQEKRTVYCSPAQLPERIQSFLQGKVLIGHGLSGLLNRVHVPHAWMNQRDSTTFRLLLNQLQDAQSVVLIPKTLPELSIQFLKQNISDSLVERASASMELYKLHRSSWEADITSVIQQEDRRRDMKIAAQLTCIDERRRSDANYWKQEAQARAHHLYHLHGQQHVSSSNPMFSRRTDSVHSDWVTARSASSETLSATAAPFQPGPHCGSLSECSDLYLANANSSTETSEEFQGSGRDRVYSRDLDDLNVDGFSVDDYFSLGDADGTVSIEDSVKSLQLSHWDISPAAEKTESQSGAWTSSGNGELQSSQPFEIKDWGLGDKVAVSDCMGKDSDLPMVSLENEKDDALFIESHLPSDLLDYSSDEANGASNSTNTHREESSHPVNESEWLGTRSKTSWFRRRSTTKSRPAEAVTQDVDASMFAFFRRKSLEDLQSRKPGSFCDRAARPSPGPGLPLTPIRSKDHWADPAVELRLSSHPVEDQADWLNDEKEVASPKFSFFKRKSIFPEPNDNNTLSATGETQAPEDAPKSQENWLEEDEVTASPKFSFFRRKTVLFESQDNGKSMPPVPVSLMPRSLLEDKAPNAFKQPSSESAAKFHFFRRKPPVFPTTNDEIADTTGDEIRPRLLTEATVHTDASSERATPPMDDLSSSSHEYSSPETCNLPPGFGGVHDIISF